MADENLQPDGDEDHPAENRGFAGELHAKVAADADAGEADEKRDNRDDDRGKHGFHQLIIRNGEADRKGIDAGRDGLHDECTGGDRLLLCFERFLPVVTLIRDTLIDHLSTDVAEQQQCDSGNQCLKCMKIGNDRVNTDPADHRHQPLEEGKHPRDPEHTALFHRRILQSVCHRHRKGIHREADAQQDAINDKV